MLMLLEIDRAQNRQHNGNWESHQLIAHDDDVWRFRDSYKPPSEATTQTWPVMLRPINEDCGLCQVRLKCSGGCKCRRIRQGGGAKLFCLIRARQGFAE